MQEIDVDDAEEIAKHEQIVSEVEYPDKRLHMTFYDTVVFEYHYNEDRSRYRLRAYLRGLS